MMWCNTPLVHIRKCKYPPSRDLIGEATAKAISTTCIENVARDAKSGFKIDLECYQAEWVTSAH